MMGTCPEYQNSPLTLKLFIETAKSRPGCNYQVVWSGLAFQIRQSATGKDGQNLTVTTGTDLT